MADRKPEALLVIGRITGCYGLKGWVRIHSYTEPADNFLKFGGWHIQRGGQYQPVEFDTGKYQGKGLVAHMVGVDDRTTAESFKGLEVAAPEAVLPELEEGEYYWRQLESLQVWAVEDDREILLGRVSYLLETGANDVLVVAPCTGSLDERERLIPYLPGDSVVNVDLKSDRILVNWFIDER
ncbi:MAG: ribosome maturation factor RimM [Pseudomonadota bacterium]